MSSKTGSNTPRAEPVQTVAVVTHGRPETIGEALARLERIAGEAGVELLYSAEEAEKHSREADAADLKKADLVVVLGGDGTMLRALQRTLGTGTPVIGVNFGAVGFLTSIPAAALDDGLKRVFAGEYEVAELPTLDVERGEDRHVAVNDVVVASSIVGRMIDLGWAVGGEDLGLLPCDGVLCSTPSGSTGYNLSNGGPVLVWGLDAMAVTFVAPHSLHARRPTPDGTLIIHADGSYTRRRPDLTFSGSILTIAAEADGGWDLRFDGGLVYLSSSHDRSRLYVNYKKPGYYRDCLRNRSGRSTHAGA